MTSAFIHKAGPELKHSGCFDLLKKVEQRLKRDHSFRVVDNSFGSCFGYMFFSLTELSSRHLGFLDRGRFTLKCFIHAGHSAINLITVAFRFLLIVSYMIYRSWGSWSLYSKIRVLQFIIALYNLICGLYKG